MKNKITHYISFALLGLLLFVQFIDNKQLFNGINIAKQLWLQSCIALIAITVTVHLLFKKKSSSLSINIIDLSFLTFFLYALAHTLVLNKYLFFTDKGIKVGMAFLLYITLRLLLKYITNKEYLLYVFYILLFLTSIIQASVSLLQLYGLLSPNSSIFQVTGTYANPAQMAFGLAVVFPMTVYITLALHKTIKINKKTNGTKGFEQPNYVAIITYYTGIISMLLTLLILPVTMIRTAWIMLITGTFISLLFYFKKGVWAISKKFNIHNGVLAFVTIICFVTVAYWGYALKKDSANGRFFIWKVTAEKVKDNPLLGQGFAKTETQYNLWQAAWFKEHSAKKENWEGYVAGNTKFVYNEFLEILCELGIIGLTLFLIPFFFLSKQLIPDLKTNILSNKPSKAPPARRIDTANYIGIIAILIGSLTSYLLYNLYTLVLLVAFITLAVSTANENKYVIKGSWLKIPALLTMLIATFIIISNVSTKFQAYKNFKYANIMAQQQEYSAAIKEYKNTYPVFKYNGDFLQFYAKALNMNNNHEKSIEISLQAKEFNNDVFLYTNLGNSYKALGINEKAISAYKMAENMQPNMFYPLYLQAKLYIENNMHNKAKNMANRILNKKVKLPSQAISQIKEEMRAIINNKRPINDN